MKMFNFQLSNYEFKKDDKNLIENDINKQYEFLVNAIS